jgi:hypothetical protein
VDSTSNRVTQLSRDVHLGIIVGYPLVSVLRVMPSRTVSVSIRWISKDSQRSVARLEDRQAQERRTDIVQHVSCKTAANFGVIWCEGWASNGARSAHRDVSSYRCVLLCPSKTCKEGRTKLSRKRVLTLKIEATLQYGGSQTQAFERARKNGGVPHGLEVLEV